MRRRPNKSGTGIGGMKPLSNGFSAGPLGGKLPKAGPALDARAQGGFPVRANTPIDPPIWIRHDSPPIAHLATKKYLCSVRQATKVQLAIPTATTSARPATPSEPQRLPAFPFRSPFSPEVDKTSTKLTRTVHPDRTISSNTLNMRPADPNSTKFLAEQSTSWPEPRHSPLLGRLTCRPRPNGSEQDRTSERNPGAVET